MLGARPRARPGQRDRAVESRIRSPDLAMIEQPMADFLALTRKISVERGFGCASYKEKCLQRRIAVRMRARGVHTYGEYARVLDTDATEYRSEEHTSELQSHSFIS